MFNKENIVVASQTTKEAKKKSALLKAITARMVKAPSDVSWGKSF